MWNACDVRGNVGGLFLLITAHLLEHYLMHCSKDSPECQVANLCHKRAVLGPLDCMKRQAKVGRNVEMKRSWGALEIS